MKIKTYEKKIELIEIESFEVPIPVETIYLFETGIRRSIRIEPVFTTWMQKAHKEEELYKLVITCIYQSSECKAEKFTIFASSIEKIWNADKETNEKSILRMLINDWGDTRTKERFDEDFNSYINELKNLEGY